MAKYAIAARLSVRSQLAYPAELWARTLFIVLIMFVFASLWRTTYAAMGRERLGAFSLGQMLWYLAITESIILSRPREAVRLDEEVRTGALAYQLARPYNFVLFRFAQIGGERLLRFALTLATAGALATAFSGGVGVRPAGLVAGVPALILAMSLDFAFVLALSLLALWIEDTAPLLFIYDRCLMILGGMLLPLTLFPTPLRAVADALPFAAVIYAPARLLVEPDAGVALSLLLRQAAWLAVGCALAAAVFRVASRRLQSNGG